MRDAGAVVRGGLASEGRPRPVVLLEREVDGSARGIETGRVAGQFMVRQQGQQRTRLRPEFAVLHVARPVAHCGGVNAEVAVCVLCRAQRANQRVGALPVLRHVGEMGQQRVAPEPVAARFGVPPRELAVRSGQPVCEQVVGDMRTQGVEPAGKPLIQVLLHLGQHPAAWTHRTERQAAQPRSRTGTNGLEDVCCSGLRSARRWLHVHTGCERWRTSDGGCSSQHEIPACHCGHLMCSTGLRATTVFMGGARSPGSCG